MFILPKRVADLRIAAARILLATFALLAIGATTDPARADPYRWCAVYGGHDDGGTNCGFITWEQCQAFISGLGGFCTINQFYDGRPVVTPEDRPAPRRRGPRRD